jgi:hypothetical protein
VGYPASALPLKDPTVQANLPAGANGVENEVIKSGGTKWPQHGHATSACLLPRYSPDRVDGEHAAWPRPLRRPATHSLTTAEAAVLICVALKVTTILAAWEYGLVPLFGVLAAALPGLSAASIGLRAYAELQLLVGRSRHMEAELKLAEARVKRLDPARAMVSQDLGAEAAAIAILMLQASRAPGAALRIFWREVNKCF